MARSFSRIFFLEDDRLHRDLLVRGLARHGITAVTAFENEEAFLDQWLSMSDSECYDTLLLLDVALWGDPLAGIRLFEQVSHPRPGNGHPGDVLFTTVCSFRELSLLILGIREEQVLEKPNFRVTDVVSRIRALEARR